MTMVGSTTETRSGTCEACGAAVIQRRCFYLQGDLPEFWNTPRHDAPCGLICLAGGVPVAAYKTGVFHRDAERCPRCSASRSRP